MISCMEILPPHLAALAITPSELNHVRSRGFMIFSPDPRMFACGRDLKSTARRNLEQIVESIHPNPMPRRNHPVPRLRTEAE